MSEPLIDRSIDRFHGTMHTYKNITPDNPYQKRTWEVVRRQEPPRRLADRGHGAGLLLAQAGQDLGHLFLWVEWGKVYVRAFVC